MPIGFQVRTQVSRPNSELLARFAGLHSADISDVTRGAGTMDHAIRAICSPIPRVVGPAVTISVPTSSLNVLKMGLQQSRAGDVVVVNGWANVKSAFVGANICRGLLNRRIAGLIVDGAVRDVSEIREDGLPVFARGVTTAGGPGGPNAGEVNVPIACGQCVVNPGDIIVADEDGIVVVPPHAAEEVLSGVKRLQESHSAVQPELRAGEVTSIEAIENELRDQGCEFQ